MCAYVCGCRNINAFVFLFVCFQQWQGIQREREVLDAPRWVLTPCALSPPHSFLPPFISFLPHLCFPEHSKLLSRLWGSSQSLSAEQLSVKLPSLPESGVKSVSVWEEGGEVGRNVNVYEHLWGWRTGEPPWSPGHSCFSLLQALADVTYFWICLRICFLLGNELLKTKHFYNIVYNVTWAAFYNIVYNVTHPFCCATDEDTV